MDRRAFLRAAIAAGGGAALLPATSMAAAAGKRGAGPYGSLDGRLPDANGLVLPEGFTSRVLAVGGDPVAGTDYRWPVFPDGAGTFDDGVGGWYYVCNSEVVGPARLGGASAVHVASDGRILDAYRICESTTANCGGGPTPWGTWLTCEEHERGQVWECDPTGRRGAEVRPAMGRWMHEAAAVDPVGRCVYLTEDDPHGLLYRFTPDRYPDLSTGRLDAAAVDRDGKVSWLRIPDPSAAETPTRDQAPGATAFAGGEGIWHHDGTIVFTTKGDTRVHAIDLRAPHHTLLWEGTPPEEVGRSGGRPPLFGVDNITVAAGSGDIYVAEDGGNLEVVLIAPEGDVVPFARVDAAGHDGSEITGPVFNPAGDRLYFSSQRGPSTRTVGEVLGTGDDKRRAGVTWEVSGPFRRGDAVSPRRRTTVGPSSADAAGVPPDAPATGLAPPVTTAPPNTAAPTAPASSAPSATAPVTTPAPSATLAAAGAAGRTGDDGSPLVPVGVVSVLTAVGAVTWWLRTRRVGRQPM